MIFSGAPCAICQNRVRIGIFNRSHYEEVLSCACIRELPQ